VLNCFSLRRWSALALVTLAVLTAITLGAACTGPPPPPDLVVIVIDTLRADALGVYGAGGGNSPHIDSLAGDGVLYTRAYSQAPWTTPSVGALLTSRYPTELGLVAGPDRLPPVHDTLAELLSRAGYVTAAVVSHHFVSKKWNFDQGFDHFDQSNVRWHAAVTSADVTDDALARVDEMMAAEAGPFFLFVHFFDPHFDYIEHGEFPRSDPAYAGPVRSGMVFTDLVKLAPEMNAEDVNHLRRLYESEVAFTDHHVGRLLAGLEARGRYQPSLLVLTADHGEEFLERGRLGHGESLHDEMIHVPLVIKRPEGWEAGTVVAEPVGLVDVLPTLMQLLGLEAPQDVSGRSLLSPTTPGADSDVPPSLASPSPRPVFSEASWPGLRSVVDGPFKLIHRSGEQIGLYHLLRDPDESRNLLAFQGRYGVVEEFEAAHGKLRAFTHYVEVREDGAGEVEVDPELRRQLEALGYLQ